MASVFGVILLSISVFLLETPGLVKRKRWKELIWFNVFLLTGTGLYLALVLDVYLPNPFQMVKAMYGWIVG
ncbi:hypothetical protein [Paenibacillus sp. PL2-23]|uniref:hypothetical protein n=1 Tax=Paenibacillus sp. PL2-23 TaxID=2100729 RepID=UPI0030FAE6DA